MKPMFLPGVENNPEPGPYYESLQTMPASGEEYSQNWHLFAFRPRATEHLAKVHARDHAGAGADRARPSGADCRLYVAVD